VIYGVDIFGFRIEDEEAFVLSRMFSMFGIKFGKIVEESFVKPNDTPSI